MNDHIDCLAVKIRSQSSINVVNVQDVPHNFNTGEKSPKEKVQTLCPLSITRCTSDTEPVKSRSDLSGNVGEEEKQQQEGAAAG